MPLVAPHAGWVYYADDSIRDRLRPKSGGFRVWYTIASGPYQGWTLLIAHLKREALSEGPVSEGTVIGHVSDTGNGTTGVHAHIELTDPFGFKHDPLNFLRVGSEEEAHLGEKVIYRR